MKTAFFPLVMAACWLIGTRDSSANEPLNVVQVRQAANRSLGFLESDAVKWREDHNCQACHHGSLYLWSNHVARQQGYAVNEVTLNELTHWVIEKEVARVTPDTPPQSECTGCRPDPTQKKGISTQVTSLTTSATTTKPRLSLNSVYLLNALNAIEQPDEMIQRAKPVLAAHLVATQAADGSWTGPTGRPPLFTTSIETTLLASRGLIQFDRSTMSTTSSISAAIPVDDLRATNHRAEEWTAGHKAHASYQEVDYRLLWTTSHASPNAARVRGHVEQLQHHQQADGGWSQDHEGISDAYATGQALVALHTAGAAFDNPTIQRGLSFLVKTQRTDGTWPMQSRPAPQDGKSAENLNPITYAATAWATLALVEFVPAREVLNGSTQ